MIYHVTTKQQWEVALQNGSFEVPSLQLEGFIHMSQHHQVAGVLERYYSGMNDLIVLHVEEKLLQSELKFEWSPSIQEEFPHVFGAINVDAVVAISDISNY